MPAIPERIAWAVRLIEDAPPERVLEIGCGSGVAMALLCERLPGSMVTGLDRSPVAIAEARARLAPWIASGRAALVRGALEAGAVRDRHPCVLAINVNLYWTKPEVAFAATRRLLATGGTLHLVYEPPTAAKMHALERDLTALIEANGWAIASRHTARFRTGAGLALAARPREA